MKRFFFVAALLGLLPLAGRAEAGSLYDFSFSGGGISGSGTLDATPNGDGTYTAISSTGTISGDPNGMTNLNTLIATGQTIDFGGQSPFDYDNKLLVGQNPLLTFNGLLWSSGAEYANVYYYGGGGGVVAGYYYLDSTEYAFSEDTTYGTLVTFTLNSVPEPSSVVLAGVAALAGLGAWGRRRFIA